MSSWPSQASGAKTIDLTYTGNLIFLNPLDNEFYWGRSHAP